MKRPALSLLNLIAIHNKGLVVTTDNIYTVVLSMIILLGSPGYLRSVFTALSTMPTFCISTTAIKRGTTTATLFLASLCLSSKRCAAYTPKIGGIRRLSARICAFRCITKGTPKPKKTGETLQTVQKQKVCSKMQRLWCRFVCDTVGDTKKSCWELFHEAKLA